MDYTGPQGHTIEAYVETLVSGERIVTVRADTLNNVYATPQAMYAVAKKSVKNPKRFGRSANEHGTYSVYAERLDNA